MMHAFCRRVGSGYTILLLRMWPGSAVPPRSTAPWLAGAGTARLPRSGTKHARYFAKYFEKGKVEWGMKNRENTLGRGHSTMPSSCRDGEPAAERNLNYEVLLLFTSYRSLLNFRMSLVAFPLELSTFLITFNSKTLFFTIVIYFERGGKESGFERIVEGNRI